VPALHSRMASAPPLEPPQHKRRSDPTPVLELSSPSSRSHKCSGGWEYPLSREEKKKRVMQLFQAELEARDSRDQRSEVTTEDEADAASEGGPSLPAGSRSSADVSRAPEQLVSRARSSRIVAAAAVLLIVLAALALLRANLPAWREAADGNTHCRLAGYRSAQPDQTNRSEHALVTNNHSYGDGAALAGPIVKPSVPLSNVTATVRRMQTMGHERLQHSDCPEAVLWFSSALELLRYNASANLTLADRARLQAHRGFALICSQQYSEGADELRHILEKDAFIQGETHLVNALGYAHFKMKDFSRAAEVFELGAEADPLNMILWNNLAAAKMAHGDLKAADDAMFNAAETYARVGATVDEYRTALLLDNGKMLSEKVEGMHHLRLPTVDLWIP